MEGFELGIVINRPIEEVFAILGDLENDVKWRSEWVESKNMSEGPLGVGGTFRLTGEFLGRRIPTIYEVIEYEPDRSAAWKTVSGPLPLKFQRIFERVEDGTQVTIKYEAEVRGLLKLVMSLLAGMVRQQHEGDLRKVKELIETRAL
ncbi:MAG: SRPBCC family protein [Anaerolineae bacterium]|nr:SRPBCC family protein [Anaerolineae bacterium]